MAGQNDNDEKLTPEELATLHSSGLNQRPRPDLEEKIVSILHSAGLLSDTGRKQPRRLPGMVLGTLASAASLLLGLGVGVSLRSEGAASPLPEEPTARYLFLLRNPPGTFRYDVSSERLRQEYADWAAKLEKKGQLLSGEELEENGRILLPAHENMPVTALPWSPEGEHVSGYFLIRANNYEEANQLARTLPHLEYGGVVEVRALADLQSLGSVKR